MNNKHASIELIDEMAKVKDDFKILPKDIIESMLEDMTAEERQKGHVAAAVYLWNKY